MEDESGFVMMLSGAVPAYNEKHMSRIFAAEIIFSFKIAGRCFYDLLCN